MAVVEDRQLAIGLVRKKMPGQAFQAGSQADAQLIHSLEVLQRFYRTSDISHSLIGKPRGKTVRAPQILGERPSPLGEVSRGVKSDRAVIHQLGGVNRPGKNG